MATACTLYSYFMILNLMKHNILPLFNIPPDIAFEFFWGCVYVFLSYNHRIIGSIYDYIIFHSYLKYVLKIRQQIAYYDKNRN